MKLFIFLVKICEALDETYLLHFSLLKGVFCPVELKTKCITIVKCGLSVVWVKLMTWHVLER